MDLGGLERGLPVIDSKIKLQYNIVTDIYA